VKRHLALALLLTGCGKMLVKNPTGWAMEEKAFVIEPVKDGRLMPDGWLLQNYKKVGKGEYQQRGRADVDLTFSRSDDDGFLAVDQVEGAGKKTLRTLVERFVADLRSQQLEVSVGQYRAYAVVDEPVVELAASPIEGEGIEGYEVVLSQRHHGETEPYRTVYLALIRAKSAPQVVTVYYVNSPASFRAGMTDARNMVRRVKVGDASLSAELPALDPSTSKPPGPKDPVQM
jgi:hypothetical protein